MIDLSKYKNHFDAYQNLFPYRDENTLPIETRLYMEKMMAIDVDLAMEQVEFLSAFLRMRKRDEDIINNHFQE